MIRRLSFAAWLVAIAFALGARAETPALLDEALQKWMTGDEDWAFTQRARTFDNDKVQLERLERYDPSRPDSQRWELLEIDGKPPTAAQREYWQHRKNGKPRRRSDRPLEEYFDFEHATVAGETAASVRYAVPLRKDASRFIPVEKIVIEVTVNKSTRTIEHLTAGLREPFRVALGLARITDVGLDVHFPFVNDLAAETKAAEANGTAHIVFFKLGDRAEYAWSDFKRVTPYRSPSEADPNRLKNGRGL